MPLGQAPIETTQVPAAREVLEPPAVHIGLDAVVAVCRQFGDDSNARNGVTIGSL